MIVQKEGCLLSISADLIRGHTDAIILAQLVKKDSYGYEINKTIARICDEQYELKEATLYTAFKRLEDAGLIVSYWGSESIGARRKYYRITEAGCRAYDEMRAQWRKTKTIIDALLGETT